MPHGEHSDQTTGDGCPALEALEGYALACGLGAEADGPLRAHVAECPSCRARLAEMGDANSFLGRLRAGLGHEAPGPDAVGARDRAAARIVERAGSVIGRYKLLQEIGEGGFGVVFMAEQTEPVSRRVAVKIVKAGMDTRQVLARFEAERQALAMMDHPNIARVLDAGTTDTGRPYFVMELVRGVSLTRYCDDLKLTVRERLELFRQVCAAVQHAHQKGVIHRDLKPSNVLVTMQDGAPVAKVIDFGIAKAMNQRLTERTLFTQYGQFIGTPQYMSPEQAEMSGLDVDTRSDVYSLGVMLYELLTGVTPIDPRSLRGKGQAELQRLIREGVTPRPSTRVGTVESLATVAASRGVEPRRLGLLLRGDLDWIILKALEKERTRRYETVAALSDDIRRYLDSQPVSAGPPRTAYRMRKFVRRHRAVVIAGTAVSAAVLLGAVGTSLGLLGALRAGSRLEVANAALKEKNEELAEALASAAAERDRADSETDWAFRVASVVANPFESEEQIREFTGEWEARLAALRGRLGGDDPHVIRQEALFAIWAWSAELSRGIETDGQLIVQVLAEWAPRIRAAYERGRGVLDPSEPLWVGLLNHRIQSLLLERAGGDRLRLQAMVADPEALPAEDWRELALLYEDLVAAFHLVHGSQSGRTLAMMVECVIMHWRAGDRERAEALLLEYLDRRDRGGAASQMLEFEHERVIEAFRGPGANPELYERLLRRYHDDVVELHPSDRDAQRRARKTMGDWYWGQARFEEAEQIFPEALRTDAESYHWARIAMDAGEYPVARRMLAPVADSLSRALPATHPHRLDVDLRLATCAADPEQTLRDVLEAVSAVLGQQHSASLRTMLALAESLQRRGDSEGAMEICARAVELARGLQRPGAFSLSSALRTMASIHERSGDPETTELWRSELDEGLARLRAGPANLDFEAGDVGGQPDYWYPARSGWRIADVQYVTDQGQVEGRHCAVLSTLTGGSLLDAESDYRNMMQRFDAAPYRGKHVRFTAAVRCETESVALGSRAQLWLRVDRANGELGLFDIMADRAITSRTWDRYEISGRIDDDAEWISLGVMAFGDATVWVDDVLFEVLDPASSNGE